MAKTTVICLSILLLGVSNPANAQSGNSATATGSSIIDEFNSLREQIIDDYASFQQAIFDEYVSFMGGKMIDASYSRNENNPLRPKPVTPPQYTPSQTAKVKTRVNLDADSAENRKVISVQPVKTESLLVFNKKETANNVPDVPEDNNVEQVSVEPFAGTVNINVYGLEMEWPAINISNVSGTTPVAYWRSIKQMVDTSSLIESIRKSAYDFNLGAWCTLLAVNQYTEKLLGQEENPSVMTLTHYIMTEVGYDLQLCSIAEKGARLLVPFDQNVYDTDYIPGDKKYYIYPKLRLGAGGSLQKSVLPKPEAEKSTFNLVINPSFLLPRENQSFTITDSSLKAEGDINLNLINLMKDYPLMDAEYYAMSIADSSMRSELIEKLRPQIKDMSPNDAANALLHFTYNGFKYQQDGKQFGAEKPFFVEEMFYYPYCDCEDRAIFYAYLVHNLLDLDVVLLIYPGHACTGVALPEEPKAKGRTSIEHNGKQYYVCDPTYIDSDIGMCTPEFSEKLPDKIINWY